MRVEGAVRAGIAAFAAGWALMMLEILGGRLMAPAFGTSIYQWGALIGVVMSFMAAGYAAGGRLGDGPRAAVVLRAALLAAALSAVLTPWFGPALLAASAAAGPESGAVIGAAAILAVPSFALAMVSPLAAGLTGRAAAGTNLGGTAAAAGRVTALGTLGSIGGTFFAAFVAIPSVGVSAGYALAGLLLAAALALALRAWADAAGATAVALIGLLAGPGVPPGFALVQETPYNTIYIARSAGEVRLHLNVLWAVQSRLRTDGRWTGLYYDLFAALPALTDGRRVTILGLAGGSAAWAVRVAWPEAEILGVELDPAVVDVARREFGMTGVRVAVADARRFVETAAEETDLLIVDLYNGASIPFHTATREFFAAAARRLAPGGVLAMNVASPADRDVLVGPLAATLAAVFPSVFTVDAGYGNHLLLATAEPRSVAELRTRLATVPAVAGFAADDIAATLAPAAVAGQPVLTDDRSDIEWRTRRALFGG